MGLWFGHQAGFLGSLRSKPPPSAGQNVTSGLSVLQVGCFLKTPRFPIWVVCSESHFSILFSLQPELLCDWRSERLFDLYYYDGLANQQEEIRLTVGETPECISSGNLQAAPEPALTYLLGIIMGGQRVMLAWPSCKKGPWALSAPWH